MLRDGDAWTTEPQEARNFPTSLNALAHCLQNQIKDTQIVIRFSNPDVSEIVIPIQPDNYESPEMRP